MNKYICYYNFTKVGVNSYSVTFSVQDQDGNVVVNKGELLFQPHKRTFPTMNAAKHAIRALLYTRKLKEWKLTGAMNCVCTNKKSDFVPRKELLLRTRRANRANVLNTIKATTVVPEPNDSAVYEVVNKGGMWTIVKHESPLLTADQAKTLLFQKIVNG